MRHLFASALLLLATLALAEDPVVVPAAPAAPAAAAPAEGAPPAAAAPTAKDFASKLDELWKTRDDAGTIKASDAAIADGLKAFPDDYEVLWRASRFKWWMADGMKDENQKKKTGKEGWALADQALKKNGTGAEARYFRAINIGAYSQAVGILTALGEGLEGKFNENLDFAIKNAEAFDMHGPWVSKGRYYWELPWPKRDLDKSRAMLKKVLEKEPQHLRAWLYLAETELKDGKAKDAKVAIDKVASLTIDYDPPEGRRIKGLMKPIADAIAKELK